MTDIEAAYTALENNIRTWALERAEVQAVIVVGSRARKSHSADAFSDLDLILYVDEVSSLAQDDQWLAQFGEVWAASLDPAGAGSAEWLVLYAGGLKADFYLSPLRRPQGGLLSLEQILTDTPHEEVLRRGLRVLVDKTASQGVDFFSNSSPAAGGAPDAARL